ncbi:hypothetical protein PG984_007201 [Apiospora sp. TS-2023a]
MFDNPMIRSFLEIIRLSDTHHRFFEDFSRDVGEDLLRVVYEPGIPQAQRVQIKLNLEQRLQHFVPAIMGTTNPYRIPWIIESDREDIKNDSWLAHRMALPMGYSVSSLELRDRSGFGEGRNRSDRSSDRGKVLHPRHQWKKQERAQRFRTFAVDVFGEQNVARFGLATYAIPAPKPCDLGIEVVMLAKAIFDAGNGGVEFDQEDYAGRHLQTNWRMVRGLFTGIVQRNTAFHNQEHSSR